MIPNKQIGWSQEENLLWQISKQLDRMDSILCTGPCPTTTSTTTLPPTTSTTTTLTPTTTTTTTLNPLINTNYTFVNCVGACSGECLDPILYFNVWMLQSCVSSWPQLGCEVWLDEAKTLPFASGNYPNSAGGCVTITDGVVTAIP
jgi:hypothetical protein